MNELKVLVVEDDEEERRALTTAIARRGNSFTLTGATGESGKAVKLCSANPPDVVILDLELHFGGGDGLSFLKEIKKLRLAKFPYVIVTTNNINPITHSAVRIAGAGFIITKNQKGYCADYVLDYALNAKDAFAALQNESVLKEENATDPDICAVQMQKVILNELDLLCFNPGKDAYRFMLEAILAVMENPSLSAVKYIADKYGKSKDSVSRTLQNELYRVWDKCDKEILYARYTAHIDKDRGAPTPTEFIHYYAVKLKNEIL